MLIDWFTVVAQALNFLILVWLMKRFLYQPILNAIDAREKRVAAELADAAAKAAAAKAERDQYQHKNERFDQQRAELLRKAVADADAERTRLLEQARAAVNELQRRRQASMARDADTLRQAIGERAQKEVFAIARKALSDLASTSLEDSMCAVLVRRLRALDEPQRAALAAAFAASPAKAVVRSAFALSEDQRTAIRQALSETLAVQRDVAFETAPELVGGIALAVGGQKLAWNIADYLADLAHAVDALVSSERRRGGDVPTAPGTPVGSGADSGQAPPKAAAGEVPGAGAGGS